MILLYEALTFKAVADPTWSNIENLNVSRLLNDMSNLEYKKQIKIFQNNI